jgi:uncharacterized membrane protein YecN with MAPEG domain
VRLAATGEKFRLLTNSAVVELEVRMVPVTVLYAALNALVTLLLGLNTSLFRTINHQYVGDTPGPQVVRASRAHGNNAEWVPLALLLLLLLELSHSSSLWLHILGGALFAGRIFHAAGVLTKQRAISTLGATITYVVVSTEVLWLLNVRLHLIKF